jgi:serine/threonine protein kinase
LREILLRLPRSTYGTCNAGRSLPIATPNQFKIGSKNLSSDPNIPSYIDSFELNFKSRKGFGLVQAYIEVPSLEDHLQKGRVFSEAETRELTISILEILDYLHQKSPPVVHRDIKPQSNIFYVISNLEQMLALEMATAIASWLEVDLHDRRITFDDQKLIPISHFDRDSWKRYSTEE